MSRIPIRARLALAFAVAMLVVLSAAALFVYLRVRADLNDSVTASVEARVEVLDQRLERAGGRLDSGPEPLDPEESFAQVLSVDGRLLDGTANVGEPALPPEALKRAASGQVVLDGDVDGIEGGARIVARPSSERPGSVILVAGQSLEDRDETLEQLVVTFAIGGPVAAALAALLGYLLASRGLAPVEAMRRRAAEVSLAGSGVMPLPAAHDEVRRLGETLNEMLSRMRASFERERRFVADAGHELRTPVAVLKAEIEAAIKSGSYSAEVGESLHAALDECDHLAQVTEDLLVVARSGTGELPLHVEPVPARALLDDVRRRFGVRRDRSRRPIEAVMDDDFELRADPLRLRQALGNLVDNALRHGSGEITLTARNGAGGSELTVADEGPGFPPELVGSAFDRFTRGDVTRTRGGAGLGLAIVKMIAQAHGGDAEIVPGPSGVVLVRIPRDSAA